MAAVVTEEGGTPHTINLGTQGFDCRRRERGEEKGQQKSLERGEQAKKTKQFVGRFRERSFSAINVGTIHGQEKLGDLLRAVRDWGLDGSLMRQALAPRKLGDWADFLENKKVSVWASVKVRECNSEVEQEDEHRKTIAQQIVHRSTDFLRRIIVPVRRARRGHCHRFPIDDHS